MPINEREIGYLDFYRRAQNGSDREGLILRIAILGPYFWPQAYGIEKVMYAHAKHLAARGHDVLVITSALCFPNGVRDDLPKLESIDGFKIRRLHVVMRTPPLPRLLHYPSNGGFIVRGLGKALDNFGPQIVHAHNIGAPAWALAGALYSKRTGAAFFYSGHYHSEVISGDFLRKLVLWSMNIIPLRTAKKIYHLTKRDFAVFPADYRYAPANRFAVLANGVDPPSAERLIPAASSLLNVLFVGRVDDTRKGFAVLEQALDLLDRDLREKISLTVVGSILESNRLRIEAKYGPSVAVAGEVGEAPLETAYASADIFVMPSYYEGFGMPFIEAMRYHIPVIGTSVGGVPEVVPDDAGILVPPGNPSELANALKKLIIDPALRARLGSAGEVWSRKFHWTAIIDLLEADYGASLSDNAA